MGYDWLAGYGPMTNTMPAGLEDWPEIDIETNIREANREFTPYLFRRGEEFWCSACMRHGEINETPMTDAETFASWGQHRDKARCPWCGVFAQLYETRYIRSGKTLRESRAVLILNEKEGDIYARAYWMKKDYSQLPAYEWSVRPMFYLVGAYRFTEGRAEYWAQHRQWDKFDCEAEEGRINPSRRKVREPFTEGGGCFPSYSAYRVIGLEALEESRFRYCRYREYVGNPTWRYHHCLMRYLAAASVYPRQVEMLQKLGYEEILAGMVEGQIKHSAAFNWEAADIGKAFGLTKQELRAMPQGASAASIEWYKRFRKAGIQASWEELQAFFAALPYGKEAKEAMRQCLEEGMKPGKLLAYLDGQRRQNAWGGWKSVGTVWRTYTDYRKMAAALGWATEERSVRFPKDLHARHDAATAENQLRLERARAEKLKEQEQAAAESLERRRKKYNIEAEGYVLRIAETATEILEEGRIQRHCVAGYAERHLADKLTIMFLRYADRPNTALYTIEMQGNALIQIHGYRNDWEAEVKPMEAMGWLIEPWLKWLERGSPRDKEGKPKLKINRMQEAG